MSNTNLHRTVRTTSYQMFLSGKLLLFSIHKSGIFIVINELGKKTFKKNYCTYHTLVLWQFWFSPEKTTCIIGRLQIFMKQKYYGLSSLLYSLLYLIYPNDDWV